MSNFRRHADRAGFVELVLPRSCARTAAVPELPRGTGPAAATHHAAS